MTEDGQAALTVVLILDGQEHTLTLRTRKEREIVACEGWPAFHSPQAISAYAA